MSSEIAARQIHLDGKVQGVGFRPFVYRLAREAGLVGWVSNGLDGVHIRVQGEREALDRFWEALLRKHPPIAAVTHSEIREAPLGTDSSFVVRESSQEGKATVLLLPDLDLCESCRSEMHDSKNRRFQYPFTTCTDCGPRYSIIRGLPYDRERTTMEPFPMCPECAREYRDPADRRFYSQTNSCPTCGVRVDLLDSGGARLASGIPALDEAAGRIARGEIVALKGVGGYLLLVDAANPRAVEELRRRKRRPTKPFALLFADLESIRREARAAPEEERWLLRREKPIVILDRREAGGSLAPGVAPEEDTLGIMLPSAPLPSLLLDRLAGPVVATSANLSDSPILATEREIVASLGHVVDAVLSHNREIESRLDDSVVRFSPFFRHPILLRRARGFAPLYLSEGFELDPEVAILAMGAHQKSTVALAHQGKIYLSQPLGDLESWESQENFRATLSHLRRLLSFVPKRIAVDLHPGYASTEAGRGLAGEWGLRVEKVQHHRAHFWSLLAEHSLLWEREPVLGVIWDGTGLGEDGAIWGGEFFLWREGRMERVAHFDYLPLLLGEKAIREPRLSAFGLWHSSEGLRERLEEKLLPVERRIYRALLARGDFPRSSSVGRLFDGVASLLGLADRVSFEGEAARGLERIALRLCRALGGVGAVRGREPYPLPSFPSGGVVGLDGLRAEIARDLVCGVPSEEIALRFHLSLASLVGRIVEGVGCRRVALGGGVFQNGLLVDLIEALWGERISVYIARELSPNDESISFGQMVASAWGSGSLRRVRS
ncbi:Carbamoyltransferase HypF [Methylacidimicrobium cyclopophantes]|uniref:Carbamoyltransferase n=1 Tax=Methylacidimicrobium cyclopophantes TaxID=1041766 RepID=A0A5E6MEB5_9BACT|nr:carbamoyltransferase HypF [Methylacidimicrobium cyclopophantes]VVM06601.1 Carbamoyltransferase HypF [Methylacidimicrobium cyclopophantes]